MSRFEDFYDFLVELEEDVLPETLVPEELLQGCLEPATATKAEKNGGKPKKAKPWETKKATKATAVAATREKKKAPPFPVPPLVDDEEDGEVVEADDEEEDWGDLRLGDVVTVRLTTRGEEGRAMAIIVIESYFFFFFC